MVSSAVFSDLNGDGLPELILACEWGPIKIFCNDHGRLTPWDAPVTFGSHSSTLSEFTGCWSGITTGDIDGDGQLDLIVSNWGLNSSYHQPSPTEPARIYFGDFDGNGTLDMVEACTDAESGRIFSAPRPAVYGEGPARVAHAIPHSCGLRQGGHGGGSG